MKLEHFKQLDIDVAVTRVAVSVIAMASLYIDPTTSGGLFHLDRYLLAVLLSYLAYSIGTVLALRARASARLMSILTASLDLAFAALIAILTEGQTSPSFVFFVFAIVAAGIRSDFRHTIVVTTLSVVLYLAVVTASDGFGGAYLMRAVYLAIAGSLVAFFGRQRARFEERVRELEAHAQRESIARSIHDGYVQSLSGIQLRLNTCRELLSRGDVADASKHLSAVQLSVTREYDEVREYLHSLAGLLRSESIAERGDHPDPTLHFDCRFSAGALLSEQVLQIMLEGLRNARRHARASSVTIEARADERALKLAISDDGIGFAPESRMPWAIASRTEEIGGTLALARNGSATIEVEIPIDAHG